MKRIAVALCVVAVCAVSAAAAPELVEMKRGVRFDHKAHVACIGDCAKCHATAEGGKIEGFGKAWAHKNCKGCHADMKKGPTACKECHKQ